MNRTMNITHPISCVIFLSLIACTFAPSSSLAQMPAEDRSNTLWYKTPAREWEEALPLGNGRLGAMVWGGIEREQIGLNEETIWAASKVEETTISSEYVQVNRRKQQLALEGKYDQIRKVTPASAPIPPGTKIVKQKFVKQLEINLMSLERKEVFHLFQSLVVLAHSHIQFR